MRDTAKTDTESSTKTPKPGGSALARAFWRALAFTSMLFGLLAACGGPNSGGGSTPPPATGIHLTTMAGPTCPVQRAGAPPCVSPISAEVVVADGSGQQVADVTTDAAGHATVALAPGDYTVQAKGVQGATTFPRPPQPTTVHVAAGAYASLTLDYDTGIR